MHVASHHRLTSCGEPNKAMPENQKGMRRGWQPTPQRMWGGRRGNRNQRSKEVAQLSTLRLPTTASLLDELGLGSVIGNPEERCVFQGDPTGCQGARLRTDCLSPPTINLPFDSPPTGMSSSQEHPFQVSSQCMTASETGTPYPPSFRLSLESQRPVAREVVFTTRHSPWTFPLLPKGRTEINVLADFPLPT